MKEALLNTITSLSHEFGTPDFVKGGGGNTSVKDESTLWIKPSGTTLGALSPETFVAVDRAKLSELYDVTPPADSAGRESLVKDMMMAAVRPESSGRPSVETPLHDSFSATYVVHTHATLGNGMTCAVDGKAACARLFPEALWMDYIDPGYTLCIEVRQAIQDYAAANGQEPAIIFLKNHGVFVAGNTAEDIQSIYAHIIDTLKKAYAETGTALVPEVGPDPDPALVERIRAIYAAQPEMADGVSIQASGAFAVANGPISPDHIVYSKTYPLMGEVSEETVLGFKEQHGYLPKVLASDAGVFGVGPNENSATLALTLAQDGAQIQQLAPAFGGLEFMDQRAVDFIDNWEVEAFRRAVMKS